MNMLEIHKQAALNTIALYHEFIGRYRKTAKRVYGFVEGKDDPSFYRGAIDELLPQGWEVDLWPAGNKTRVICLYNEFDWDRFPRVQVVFFIDRDLSLYTGQELPVEDNMYITDNYSIENDIVCRNTCDRILTEICGFDSIGKEEKDRILALFESQLDVYKKQLLPIMAWIIHWLLQGLRPSLDCIRMDHLFTIQAGNICAIDSPKGFSGYEEYIHHQCDICFQRDTDISAVEKRFRETEGYRRYIRGKYLLWFMVQFVLSIHANITMFSSNINKPPKMKVSLGVNNAVIHFAPRTKMPESLRAFLVKTCIRHALEWKDVA